MKLHNRSTLLKINSVISLLYQVIVLVCGFILPKLIIENYGSSVNGLISSITQFLGIIALCEMGMGAVVPASLYKPLADKNDDEISKVIVSSERFYRRIAVFMLVYVLLMTFFYPLIVERFSFYYTTLLIVIIASSSFAQYFFGISYSLLITADQRQYISYFVNGGTLIINLIISFVLIRMGCSIHIVKLLSAVIFLMRPLCYTFYVKQHYNLNKQITYDREPIKQKWNGVAQHLAYTVQEKAGFILLSVMSTLEIVSVYSVYFLITEGIRAFVYSVTSGLTSYLGNIFAKGEKNTLLSSFGKIEWSLHTITIVVYSSAAVLILPFVSIYTKGINDANYLVSVFPYLMCAVIGVRCLQLPYIIVVQAAGHFKETQKSAIIEPVINITISVLLINEYNIIGVAIGMLVSIIYRMMYLSLYLTTHILFTSKLLLLKRLVVDVILVVAIVLPCSYFNLKQLTYASWVSMAIEVLLCAIVITLILNFIFYRKATIDFIKSTLLRSRK